MTHFIPRAKMPQVDEKDLPWMLAEVQDSMGWKFVVVLPENLVTHQYVHHGRALAMPEEVAQKPIIISSDGAVIDGNHRLFNHKAKKGNYSPILAIQLPSPFEEALDYLLEQEYTYTINPRTHERN